MKNKFAAIISHDRALSFERLIKLITELTKSVSVKIIYCPGFFSGQEEALILKAALGKRVRFFSIAKQAGWYGSVFRLLKSGSLKEQFLFFISSSIDINSENIDLMAAALLKNDDIAGVNPAFSGNGQCVHNLGLALDSGLYVHLLYNGIEEGSELANRERHFQMSTMNALCVRKKDMAMLEESFLLFAKEMEELLICAYLARSCKKGFLTLPQATCVQTRPWHDFYLVCLWNSYMLRGKIPYEAFRTDYPEIIRADKLAYGIDEWLNEGPKNFHVNKKCNTEFFNRPVPENLLAWLGSLPEKDIAYFINFIRSMPWCLPHEFQWYKVRCRQQSNFAQINNLGDMLEDTVEWFKNEKKFHYGKLRAGMRLLQRSGIYNADIDFCPGQYDAWLELNTESAFSEITEEKSWPEIGIVMPVYNPVPTFLKQAIESVLAQNYSNWELSIADDCSTMPETRSILETYARQDRRIKVTYRQCNGHISEATNTALAELRAPWAAFLDHDDMLAKNACFEVAKAIVERPALRFVYSDEDHIDAWNVRRSPIFSPGFDYALNFTGHLSCFKTDLVINSGGLRKGLEGCQDYDLELRLSDELKNEEIYHISRILYHWRIHGESTTAGIQAKPYVLNAQNKALEEYAKRHGMKCQLHRTGGMNYMLELGGCALDDCAILLLCKDGISTYLHNKLHEIQERYGVEIAAVTYGNFANNPFPDNWRHFHFEVPTWDEASTAGIGEMNKKYVMLLDSSLEPQDMCRLEQLFFAAKFWRAGLSGAYFWRGNELENAGLFPNIDGFPFPLLKGHNRENAMHLSWSWLHNVHRVIGVDLGCMVIDREKFLHCGAFNSNMGKWLVADYCLRLEQAGAYAIASPWVNFNLTHSLEFEKSDEDGIFFENWGEVVKNHPLRNSNLKKGPGNGWTLIGF